MKTGTYIFLFNSLIAGSLFSQSRVQELQVTQYKQSVIVNYQISAGSSCSGYQIQRSTDTVNFETIYDYSGVCGELTKPQAITFSDAQPQKNSVNYYRVIIAPSDHSKIVSIVYSDVSEKGYLLYENPVAEYLKLLSATKGKLKIFSQTGHLVREFLSNEDGSYHENISYLDNGLYYFSIEPVTGQSVVGKFIKK